MEEHALMPLDMDSAVQYATEDYISSLDLTQEHSIDELKVGILEVIHQKFDEHNVLNEKNNKWQYPKSLPNACVAALMRITKHIRCISWTGKRDDYCYLAAYQEDGEFEGLYIGSDIYFNKLIRQYKFGATLKDIDEIIEILKADSEFVTPNSDRDLIAVNNGIFDYRTKQLIPFSPDYVFTAKSKVNYIPNAVNPHYTMHDGLDWDVDTWFESLSDDPEVTQLLWEVVGAIIRPHVRWDKVVCMYSQKGMNGKGTLCELMKQLCGEGTYASIPFDAFEKNFMLSQLISATAIITDENGTTEFTKNAANLKAIVTGDSISIDRKYKEPITIKFSGLTVECINALPRISDNTDSLYRRFLIIPFEKTFQGVERKYIKTDYLHRQEVLEYVLFRVLNTDYYTLSEPLACQDMLDDYKNFNDCIRQFIDEILPLLSWNLIPQNFLYDLYIKWSDKNNPSAIKQGKRTFLDKVKNIIDSDYADEWSYNMGQKIGVNKKNMNGPERLIHTYHLTDWMAPNYKGSDVDKICLPALSTTYYGLVRREP